MAQRCIYSSELDSRPLKINSIKWSTFMILVSTTIISDFHLTINFDTELNLWNTTRPTGQQPLGRFGQNAVLIEDQVFVFFGMNFTETRPGHRRIGLVEGEAYKLSLATYPPAWTKISKSKLPKHRAFGTCEPFGTDIW